MDQRPKYKFINYKCLGKNIGVNLQNFGLDNRFLAMISKAQATKEGDR